MSGRSWWMRVVIAMLALAPHVQAALAGALEGSNRESFIKSSNESCNKKGSTPENLKIFTPAMIVRFCSCVTEKVADKITAPEVIAAIRDGKPSADTEAMVRAVSPGCLKDAVQ